MILVKELVNCKTYRTSHSENRSEKIGSESKMRLFTKNFQRVFFRLKNCFFHFFREIITKNCNFFCNNFNILTFSFTFYYLTCNFKRRSSFNIFDDFFVEIFEIYYNLNVVYRRTVIQRDETVRTECSHPTLNGNIVM